MYVHFYLLRWTLVLSISVGLVRMILVSRYGDIHTSPKSVFGRLKTLDLEVNGVGFLNALCIGSWTKSHCLGFFWRNYSKKNAISKLLYVIFEYYNPESCITVYDTFLGNSLSISVLQVRNLPWNRPADPDS